MKEELKSYRKSIKKKHRFSFWSEPEYQENLKFNADSHLFLSLCENVFSCLEWRIISLEKNRVVAESSEKWKTHGIIEVSLKDDQSVNIKSKTMFDQTWDNGQNSVRVKLFIKAFKDEVEELSDDQKRYTQDKIGRNYKFSDYKYPLKLPEQLDLLSGNVFYPTIAGVTTSLIVGFFYGYFISNGYYITFVPELVLGLSLWFSITLSAKLSNFFNTKVLLRISLISFFLLFPVAEITNYLLIEDSYTINSFLDHLVELFSNFSPSLDVQSIFMTLFLLILFFTFYFFYRTSLIKEIRNVVNESIPDEVKKFVQYLVSEGRTETEIRNELTRFGWKSEETQNFLIEEKLGHRF